jgi:hypothetical protein
MIKVTASPAANTAETHRKIWARRPSTTGSSARRCSSTRVPILMGTTLSPLGPSLGELLVTTSSHVSLTAPSDSRRSGLHGTRAAITAHIKQSAANTLRAIFIQGLRLCLPTPPCKLAPHFAYFESFAVPIQSPFSACSASSAVQIPSCKSVKSVVKNFHLTSTFGAGKASDEALHYTPNWPHRSSLDCSDFPGSFAFAYLPYFAVQIPSVSIREIRGFKIPSPFATTNLEEIVSPWAPLSWRPWEGNSASSAVQIPSVSIREIRG